MSKKVNQEKIRSVPARLWMSVAVDDQIRSIANAEGRSISAVYRDLVEKGLVAGGYRSGGQDLAALVREAVREELRPQAERLAAISAKGTQISAASFFLAAFSGRQAVPEYLQEEYDEVAAQARKLGVEYLKLSRDKSLDDFIARGLGRMGADE